MSFIEIHFFKYQLFSKSTGWFPAKISSSDNFMYICNTKCRTDWKKYLVDNVMAFFYKMRTIFSPCVKEGRVQTQECNEIAKLDSVNFIFTHRITCICRNVKLFGAT